MEFKQGAFKIAKEAGVDILPVALKNAHLAVGRNLIAGPAHMVVTIGTPIKSDDIEQAIKTSREWLEATVLDKPKGQ
jgi:1-acyl-sn-glycerol-3-phosphate acyltransferase